MIKKSCRQCQKEFIVTDGDLDFYKKISPTFSGKTFEIPAPTLCPECREIRRMLCRNERVIYKRKSDHSQEELISIFAPDKNDYKVFSPKEWYSDAWDPISFGRDFDPLKTFFEQLNDLIHDVPRPANNLVNVENCDFCNQVWNSKNCYLCFNASDCENCMYCSETHGSKKCIDCFDIRKCEFCQECFDCARCFNSKYLDHCKDCTECYFVYDCSGCKNVMMSNGLHNKQYVFRNEQLTKEGYEAKREEFNFGKKSVIDELKKEFRTLKSNAIHKETHNINSENCTGDYLIDCKDCNDCFNALKAEGCVRVFNVEDNAVQCHDMSFTAHPEMCYEGAMVVGYMNLFGMMVIDGNNNLYCQLCESCKDCFGCVGLRQKQYCILNKQYTKEEYGKKVGEVVEKMVTDCEWGEFFPAEISPYGYNETVAQIYYPSDKERVATMKAKWQDNDYSMRFEGSFYEPSDDIKEYKDEVKAQELLNSVIKCQATGRPFRIMPQELAYYIENDSPIPSLSSESRYKELFALRNPRHLYHRQCMCEEQGHGHVGRCPNEFETTYAPDRPEKVYCENCYQKSVI